MDRESVADQQLNLEHAVKEYFEAGTRESREQVISQGQTMAGYF